MSNTVWGLDTGRPGEFMQVEILGTALGLGFERIRLSAEGQPLTPLPATPPRVILSFGSAARIALRLARDCAKRPLLIHLGTPGQTPVIAFDLIIPMPQDDYPAAPNVLFLQLPLNGANVAASSPPPAGNCTIIIGGPSRHFRMPPRAIRRLIRFGTRLAAANAEPLHVITSPRTPEAVLAELGKLQADQNFALHGYGSTPFTTLLQTASRFVVTADSASMLGEACRTGVPVWLFPLPARANLSTFLQHATDRCLGSTFRHRLVRQGLIGGGTNFQRWHRKLERDGYIFLAKPNRLSDAALRQAPASHQPDTDLHECRARILSMLAEPKWAEEVLL